MINTLNDDGSYRAQQAEEELKLAYILALIERVRSRSTTEEDARYLEHELTPHLTQPRK